MNHNKTSKVTCILLALLILCLCAVHAVTSIHNADFGPLNGTFQDFNPIRRLLAGQIPYKDFSDYLGLGHLYLGSLATLIFGGTFFASKTAFVFLAFLSLGLIAAVLGTAVFRSPLKGLSAAAVLLSLLLIKPLFFVNNFAMSEEIGSAFDYALKNGNSARMVRAFVLPLVCCFILAGYRFFRKRGKTGAGRLCFLLFAFGSGFALPWGNDYGISTWLCLMIMFAVLLLARTRSLIRTLLLGAAALCISLLGTAAAVSILTLGHLPDWIRATFGIGGFQGWYPNTVKHFYIFNIDLNWCSTLQAILCVLYIVQIFRDRGAAASAVRYGIPCLANLTGFCAMNEYYMISGDSAREVGLIILTLTVAFETAARLLSSLPEEKVRRGMVFTAAVCAFTWIIPAVYSEFLYRKMTMKAGEYIPEMGGRVTELADSLKASKTFLGDEKIFSTYASAAELVTGQFHPSGTDYIIHVLGDGNREKYLEDFASDDFRYAVTVREAFSPWEYYIRRSNWYFYRELYRGWHPVFSNKYQLYWERNEAGQDFVFSGEDAEITVTAEQDEPTRVRVTIRTDESVTGFADLAIDYSVEKNGSFLSKLMFQRMLYISQDRNAFSELGWYDTNYLRDSGKEYIPVAIVDGYGEIVLSSVPQENTRLTLRSAECSGIFTVPFEYLDVTGLGYSGETPCLKTPKSAMAKAAAAGKDRVRIGPYEIPVTGTAENEDDLMLLLDMEGVPFNDLEQLIRKQPVASFPR